jgi:hypothetical protein
VAYRVFIHLWRKGSLTLVNCLREADVKELRAPLVTGCLNISCVEQRRGWPLPKRRIYLIPLAVVKSVRSHTRSP